ncbi:hypothetical protein ARALYDRAFT_907689 [Arabidopsis lyrata subsp. lyrata]|uniref:Uncharacterized protein n=1 Tax=Arabidopsis lyrata subsp. lyrata TaxID=81972 RepID=D7LSA6_ARALL|nr:uncharacterized protein LOC9312687 isoform X1 [Arabidopsis lyrata subsp. lyrata]EFH54643.1 hypothetical protein ARALYDRAFT_907689 [Arabidopsis lyrata subsp. lyrata]|eukprot:XP_002878384.1 uncharacterized protein LOC9312687 isoform X1 [Arabidopsis lyrata subsp. lyrata]
MTSNKDNDLKKKSEGNVSIEDRASKLMAEGDTLFKNKDWAGAIKIYEKGLHCLTKGHRYRAMFHDRLSYCLMHIEPINYKMIASQCSKALHIKPDDSRPLLRRAQAYEALGKISMALADLNKLLKANPTLEKAKDMWYRLSMIQELKKKRAIEFKALEEEWEKEASVDKEALEEVREKEGSVSSVDLAIEKWDEEWEKGSSVSDEMEELNKTGSASNEVKELEIMELSFEKLFSRLFGKEEIRILMAGLDATGKTMIMDKLKHGEIMITTTATLDCNVETVEYKNINFSVWDVWGEDKRHYFHHTHGLIFVVDCNDGDSIVEAKDELHLMMKKGELRDAVLLVFANNQALPNAMNTDDITDKLELHSLHQQVWCIHETCASSGYGLYKGLDCLSKNIAYKKDFSDAELIIDTDLLEYFFGEKILCEFGARQREQGSRLLTTSTLYGMER